MSESYMPNPNLMKFARTDVARQLKNNHRWTISEKKKPLNIHALLNRMGFYGAETHDQNCLTTMDGILKHPQLCITSTITYYLDADLDNLVILDIEPDCPETLRNQFLKMPCLYAEWSMSGKGIHMVFEYPYDILEKYEAAKEKIVMKGEHKYYEILMQHYVTFTGNTEGLKFCYGKDQQEFRRLFEKLAKKQKPSKTRDLNLNILEPQQNIHDEIKLDVLDRILYLLKISVEGFHNTKNKERYEYDESRYEFAFLGHVFYNLEQILKSDTIKKTCTLTEEQKARIVYEMALRQLPFREKHNEIRKGLPWLYFETTQVMAKNNLTKESETDKTETEVTAK